MNINENNISPECTDLVYTKSVPKIIYGVDSKNYCFIYFKWKNFVTNTYDFENFIFLYQKNTENVSLRMNKIIEYITKKYQCSTIMNFGARNHFFIKNKVFSNNAKIKKFYNNLILNISTEILTVDELVIFKSKYYKNDILIDNVQQIPGILNVW